MQQHVCVYELDIGMHYCIQAYLDVIDKYMYMCTQYVAGESHLRQFFSLKITVLGELCCVVLLCFVSLVV